MSAPQTQIAKGILVLALLALTASACGLGQDVQSANQAVGAIDPATDVQAKTNLQTALAAGQTEAAGGSYAAVTPTTLSQAEPSLTYVGGNSTGPNVVSVAAGAGSFSMAVLSTSGTCFFGLDGQTQGTRIGSAKDSCSASNAAKYATQAS